MIRRFILAEGDNSPETSRIEITPISTNGTYFVETGFPVSWAIITGGGDTANSTTKGPIYFDPTGLDLYSISSLSGGDTYQTDSLQVFLNGVMLDNGIHFDEDANQDDFHLNIGAGALPSAPALDNQKGTLTFSGQTSSFNIGKTLTQGGTGTTAKIVGTSNDSLTTGQLNLIDINSSGLDFDSSSIVDNGTIAGSAAIAGDFIQGGDRMAVYYRPVISVIIDGVRVYISSKYPESTTGFEIAFEGATISSPFIVDVVYQ